jgi:hypothetical protein
MKKQLHISLTLGLCAVVFLFFPKLLFSQTDTLGKVKYTSDFVFNDGVYKTFQEFKNDSPSVKKFIIKKLAPYSNPNYIQLEYICTDSLKSTGNCDIKDVWGYANKGDIYIAHNYYAYYFKLMVVGALCHFSGLTGYESGINANQMTLGFGNDADYQQFMLDFETGEIEVFNYKKFSAFLLSHDSELYNELQKQKKKKKLIFKYLLKYNERHPIWFRES